MFENRGIMLDPARLLEKRSYYYELLPWLEKWGYNILHFHFADDTGCAVRLPSHPELSKPNAFTPDEMREFIAAAAEHGLTVIPELESLGHTQFITSDPKFTHLGPTGKTRSSFNSLHPDKEACRELLRELLTDVCEIFPSEIIHVGLDEVDMSGFEEFKDLNRDEQMHLFANHAIWMHQQVRELGRRPAMWGDHILATPAMADLFEKDVLIFDWHYDAPFDPASLDLLLQKGFEVWGCPASIQYFDKLMPSARNQLQNIREFSACALVRKDQGVSGMVLTIWTPRRFLSGIMDFPMAFGGHLFSAEQESQAFTQEFCAEFYGLNASDAKACASLLWQMHGLGQSKLFDDRLVAGSCNETSTITLNREEIRLCRVLEIESKRLGEALKPIVAKASQHAERLNDYTLTAGIIEVLARVGAGDFEPAAIGDITDLHQQLQESWARTKDETWESIGINNFNIERPLRVIHRLMERAQASNSVMGP